MAFSLHKTVSDAAKRLGLPEQYVINICDELGVVACACNLSIWDVATGGL